ncbi:MAG: hypothetical protein J6M34_03900 [Clostridia bacterium]|nr:hypothetical protein [Clostridia bacterium]
MKEWLYRALRTFGQAALGYLAANLLATVTEVGTEDGSVLKTALLGLFAASVAAGLAAVMNRGKKEEADE